MPDLPTPSAPEARHARRSRPSRLALVAVSATIAGFKAVGLMIVLVLMLGILDGVMQSATRTTTIPISCHESSGIDYAHIDRPDLGPYAVKLLSARHFPWGTRTEAVIGHDLTADSSDPESGVVLRMESADIDAFRCRWTSEGVTIVEPHHHGGHPGVEHFVPAELYLGGRRPHAGVRRRSHAVGYFDGQCRAHLRTRDRH